LSYRVADLGGLRRLLIEHVIFLREHSSPPKVFGAQEPGRPGALEPA
jgi:hypothetical protein